jgi:hypothetical protein
MKRPALILIFFCWALAASAQDTLSQQPGLKKPFFHTGWGRALMSAAVPGSAQLARREWLRGGLYLAGEAFLVYDAFHFWDHQYERPPSDHAGRIYDRDTALGLATWYGLGALFVAADAWYATTGWRETVPMRAMWHSLVFPGWGQLSNGQRWRAAIVFGVQTGLAYSVFTQHQRFHYHQSRGEEGLASFYKNDRNRLVWWSVGLLLASSAEAYVGCHLRDWNVSPDLSLSPTYFPEQKTVGLSLSLITNR